MAYPKTLRNKMGLTNEAFADLIDCSTGQLSMAEAGKRKLPWQSVEILKKLEEAWAKTENNELFSIKPDKSLNNWLNKHIRKAKLQAAGLKIKADIMEQKAAQATRLLALAQLPETEYPLPEGSNAALKLKIIEKKTAQKLQLLTGSLTKLYIAIRALEAEIATAEYFKL
jgi:transcriptional regulator with XRE-family HTH domain